MNIEDLKTRLTLVKSVLGVDMNEVKQGDYDWLRARLGVITASNASAVIAKSGSMTRDGYMATLIGEIATGAPLEGNAPSGKAIDWGNENEPAARESYQFMTMNHVDEFPFVFSDDMRCGCSPDGLITGLGRGLEIKCPFNTRYHIELLVDGRVKKEYMDQVQYSMWVTGAQEWEFVSFDPRMKSNILKIVTISRDEKYMTKFAELVPQFIEEMDRKMQMIGLRFGDQWK